ncbi:MAG: hypothetical protein ACOCVL_00700, partial [Candidatus Sumerlaeota bacterium]
MHRVLKAWILLLLLSVLSGCWRSFQSPIQNFDVPPETTGALQQHLQEIHGDADNLFSRARVTVSRKHRPGKYRAVFYSIYLAPDNAMLKVDDARVGEFFRVVQRGDRVAVSLSQEGEFYVGNIEELENASEALMGLQPTDVARAVRVGSALPEGLASLPDSLPLPGAEGGAWRLGLTSDGKRMEIYTVRRKDGLVRRLELVNPNLEPRVRIEYT